MDSELLVPKVFTADDGIEIRAQVRRYQLIPWRCVAGFVPKSAIWTMWVNGKTADLAKKISPQRDAPGRSQVAHQVAGANSGPLKNGRQLNAL